MWSMEREGRAADGNLMAGEHASCNLRNLTWTGPYYICEQTQIHGKGFVIKPFNDVWTGDPNFDSARCFHIQP